MRKLTIFPLAVIGMAVIMDLLATAPARPATVLETLTQNIRPGMSDDDKLSVLMYNMKKVGFQYRGAGNVDELLAGRSKTADCGALARLFVKVGTENLKIKGLSTTFEPKDTERMVFVKGGSPIIDPTRGNGNVDNAKHWAFANHVWAKQKGGKVYDPLFGLKYGSDEEVKKSFELVTKFRENKAGKVLSGFTAPDGTKYYRNDETKDLRSYYTSTPPASAASGGAKLPTSADE